MLLRDLQPFTAPDALHPIPTHAPARDLQQGRDPAIAVAAVLGSKGHDGSGEGILVSSDRGDVALGPARLADNAAGVALRETVLLPDAVHRLPAPLREATSFRICFSSERSATRR